MNKLMVGVIGSTLMVIMLGAVLVPVIQDSQVVLGDNIEYPNTTATTYLIGEYKGNVTMDIASNGSVVVVSINGVDHPLASVANTNVIISDAVTANPNSSGTLLSLNYANGASSNVSGSNVEKLVFEDGILTATHNGSVVYTGPYHALYSLQDDGPMRYKSISASDPAVIRSVDDIVSSTTATLGGSATVICISHGKAYGPDGYTYEVIPTMTLRAGTTDLYDLTALSVKATNADGDTSITFSRPNVPVIAHGHEDSGASYDLVGAIPVIMILVVIASSIAVIGLRRMQ